MKVEKGQWFWLPSGRVGEVCALVYGSVQTSDEAMSSPEVELRILDGDAAMGPVALTVSMAFLLKHTKRVVVAPPISV